MRLFVSLLLVSTVGCTGVGELVGPLTTADGGSGAAGSGGGSGGTGGAGGGAAGGAAGGGAAGGGAAGAAGGGAAGGGAGGGTCAAVSCSTGSHCNPATTHCDCDPGFTASGPSCVPVNPGSPAAHTQAEVCTAYTNGMTTVASGDGFTTSAATCDPGSLSRDAMNDALARLNMHRWLAGLGPVTDDASSDAADQQCATIAAWNPAGPGAHNPPTTSTCYSAAGAGAAGSSNIAWGCGSAADAMDQWFMDYGNESTFGHRRWLLNPPLGPVGIGYYRGGNNYGSASCIAVFGGGGGGPSPAFVAYPPPGFIPAGIAQWTWTVQGNLPSAPTATVTRQSDGTAMAVNLVQLQGSYGYSSAISLERQSWTPAAGETYHVAITGTGTPIEYDVKPVTCP